MSTLVSSLAIQDYIALGVILLLVVAVIYYMKKRKKSGKSGCSGCCGGCPYAGKCSSERKESDGK